MVDAQSKTLGNDNDDGDWYDTLSVSVTMTEPMEQYQLLFHNEIRDIVDISPFGDHTMDSDWSVQAIQGKAVIGDFTLDFVPLTIVYCPPGQDMTNSLTQTETFGTRLTLGESQGMQSDSGEQVKVSILGLVGEGIGFSNSQSMSNQSVSGIQISHFRNTIVTADNQKAVGRAYWGPLNDIFVILVNPSFAASRRADGTMFYHMTAIQQVLLIPARKLLRPDNDPIAGAIPENARRRLLELDPFITHLNEFFPDSGADLARAANPFADPSANNRAELLGRWWLDGGTIVNYSEGETHQLMLTETNEVRYASGVSINASAGVNYDGIAASLGVGNGTTTTVGLQSSKENDASLAKNAACFLIRNQNERDLDGVEVYFDKIFSTFMFRRLRTRQNTNGEMTTGAVSGTVYGVDHVRMRAMGVSITDEQGNEQHTSTQVDGGYSFYNLPSGKYTIVAGDQKQVVTVTEQTAPVNPVRADVKNVRRPIDLHQSPVWEVTRALGLPSDKLRQVVARLPAGADLQHLAREAGVDQSTVARWQRAVVVQPRRPTPKPPAKRRGGGHDDDDRKPTGPKRGKRR